MSSTNAAGTPAASLPQAPLVRLRNALKVITGSRAFGGAIISLILINAAILGLETYPDVIAVYGPLLKAADRAILWIFVGELALKLFAHGPRLLRDPWSLFDAVVIALAFMPANEAFAVLRALRVLRVLRLISIFPRLRRVVEGLARAIPGIGSIGAILLILFYVFAVMASKLFGASHPEWFGTLQTAMFTLFQIMTLEGWADIVRDVMVVHPHAWVFFIIYILAATFTVLNLFIAVIVDAMQRQHQDEARAEQEAMARIETGLAALHRRLDALGPAPAAVPRA